MTLLNVFMEKLMSMGMSLSILIGVVIVLIIALRSQSDGKQLIKTIAIKRNLVIEIILFAMAIIEGFNAAGYAVKEGRDYGSAIAMHVLGGALSGAFAFAISKQAIELTLAVQKGKHILVICKEAIDVIGSFILSIAAPALNAYFVAVAAHSPTDFWSIVLFDWGNPIHSGSVMYSTGLGMLHVFGCLVLSVSSLEIEKIFEESGGTPDPLTQASDSEIDDDADDDTDDEEESTPAPNTDVIPYSRIPNVGDLINYVKTHFSNRVDINAFEQKMRTDERFMDRVAVKIEDALKARDKWDNEKAKLNSYNTDLRSKQSLLSARQATKRSFTQAYNRDTADRVVQGIQAEIDSINDQITALESKISVSSALVDSAEDAYNVKLDLIGDLLDTL